MFYDQSIFKKFRELAVTDGTTLQVGKTYYGNFDHEFTIAEILTEKQHRINFNALNNVELTTEFSDDVQPRWVKTTEGGEFSLWDSNVGASYNPWLIFEDEQIAIECREQLVITFGADPSEDWGDDEYEYEENPRNDFGFEDWRL